MKCQICEAEEATQVIEVLGQFHRVLAGVCDYCRIKITHRLIIVYVTVEGALIYDSCPQLYENS